jgi:hypothetical protein
MPIFFARRKTAELHVKCSLGAVHDGCFIQKETPLVSGAQHSMFLFASIVL